MAAHDAADRPAQQHHTPDLTPDDAVVQPIADPAVADKRARILARLDAHPDVADPERGEF